MPSLKMTVTKAGFSMGISIPEPGFPGRRIPENALGVKILIHVKRFESGSVLRAHPREYARMNYCLIKNILKMNRFNLFRIVDSPIY